MEAGAVLYVHTVTNADIVDVATNHGVEPHGALVAHRDIADDGCVLRKIAVFPPLRGQAANGFD
jgi:hypothetical protein